MTREEIQELLAYDAKTGKITWRFTTSPRSREGQEAGSIDGDGYRLISLNYKKRSAHRLAFDLMGIEIPPGMQVDHINGKRDDNRWSNLRLVTGQQNNMNTKIQKNNKSGVTGVSWNSRDSRWTAAIKFRGKRYHLGTFRRREDAIAARKDAEQKYGFHGNHGRFELEAQKTPAER